MHKPEALIGVNAHIIYGNGDASVPILSSHPGPNPGLGDKSCNGGYQHIRYSHELHHLVCLGSTGGSRH